MKKLLTSLIFLSLLLSAGKCYAEGIPITGIAYSEEIGILHFDYTTAINPSPGNSKFNNSKYYIGPKKQFYIDPYAESILPGNDSVAASISTDAKGCDTNSCLLKGYIWSDTIGWTAIDGEIINDAISKANNLSSSQENTAVDPYPSYMYPQLKLKPANGNRLALTGYIWNKYTGWIRLSSDDKAGITEDASKQSATSWGVWFDLDETISKALDGSEKGRNLHGYAWSEKLGWIKFSKESGDSTSFDFGTFTKWAPDTSPAILLAPSKVWFAVGVNTGSANDSSTIIWKDFAIDPESGIDISKSQIYFKSVSPTCTAPNAVSLTTTAIPATYQISGSGNILNLTIPNLGNVKTSPKGFCQYEVHAEIVNMKGNTIYMGDHYQPAPKKVVDDKKYFNKTTVFVRAGNFDSSQSRADWDDTKKKSAIADGTDSIKFTIEPKDKARNPIVPINCSNEYTGCPGRTIKVDSNIENEMAYDLTNPITTPNYPTPAYANAAPLSVGEKKIDNLSKSGFSYTLEITSYAPSSTYDYLTDTEETKALKITSFNYDITNDELPATAKEITQLNPLKFQDKANTVKGASSDTGTFDMQLVNCTSTTNPAYACPTFTPAITTSDPKLLGGLDSLSLGTPADLEFTVNNFSTKNVVDLSLDNVFQFSSTNPTIAMMEMQSITNITSGETDSDLAWTDPFEPYPYNTRYEMYMKNGSYQAFTSPFNGFYQQFHKAYKFSYDSSSGSDNITNDGVYTIIGSVGIPKISKDSQSNFLDGQIDRNDAVNLTLSGKTSSSPFTLNKKIQFTPQNITSSGTIKDIKFRVIHEVAYKLAGQTLTTVYSQKPLISNLDVKEIVMQALGTVSGTKTVTDRKFDTVGLSGSGNLQEQMRRNVAELTTGIDESKCTLSADITLSSLPTSSSPDVCVIKGSNGTVAYYKGALGFTVTINSGSDKLELPTNPYTLIIKGGADLFIADNLYYPSSGKTSFGIILIKGNDGTGSNVYISPEPTNIAAVLYAEGSLLSRNSNGELYYGGGKGNIQHLKNQLYWLGSIASRNTIGGVAKKKRPEGVDCINPGDSDLTCAQRYDFDYLRRFNVSISSTQSFIANGGKFSGGGSCANGSCSHGSSDLLTIITLTKANQIDKNSSELAPFFVKKDTSTLLNPPPGFSSSLGLQTKQEIR